MSIRIGVKLPHTGRVEPASIAGRARDLERAGFDSLWVSDHVVLPRTIDSHYPFAADGVATWASDQPWVEPVVVLAAAAGATEQIRLGSAVLVLPQRNPVLVAKQIGSLDALSAGRVELGVGAGWLEAEFQALDSDFATRGPRLEEWIAVLRDCWTGAPVGRDGPHYRLAPDLLMLPTPARRVPILIGGHSRAALRRAGQLGDGWLGQQAVPELDLDVLAGEFATVRAAAAAAGRSTEGIRFVLRLVESVGRHGQVADAVAGLAGIGVSEVIVDVDPFTGDPDAVQAALRGAADSVDDQ